MSARRTHKLSCDREALHRHHPCRVPSSLLFDYSDLHFVCGFDSRDEEEENKKRTTSINGPAHQLKSALFAHGRWSIFSYWQMINYNNSKYGYFLLLYFFLSSFGNENIFRLVPFVSYALLFYFFFVSKRCLVDFFFVFILRKTGPVASFSYFLIVLFLQKI